MNKSIVVDCLKQDAEVVESQEYGENLMTVWEGISLSPVRVAVISGPNYESFISNEK